MNFGLKKLYEPCTYYFVEVKNSLRQVKGKYDHGIQYTFTVYRLPFTVSVTLNLSVFIEVDLFLRDFVAGRKLTFGFKTISRTQGFRTIN